MQAGRVARTNEIVVDTAIPLHGSSAVLFGNSLYSLAILLTEVGRARHDEVAKVVAEAIHVGDPGRNADDELDHLCIIRILNADDRTRAQHPDLTEANVLALQKLIIADCPICGHVLNHQQTVLIEIDSEMLVADTLSRILAEYDVGTLMIATEDETKLLELEFSRRRQP
jgi:hypothetical protein